MAAPRGSVVPPARLAGSPAEPISSMRLGLFLLALAVCGLALVTRVGYLQILEHEKFAEEAESAHWSRQVLRPPRGTIRDSEGNPLAVALTTWEISLDPRQLKSSVARERALRTVSEAAGVPLQELEGKLEGAGDRPVAVARDIEYARGRRLVEKPVWGILAQERIRRAYPEGSLAAHLLGFVGRDGEGLAGIEADFERELAGVPGSLVFEQDVMGNPIPLGYRSGTAPRPGGDVVLTIDRFIQRVVERELDAAIKSHKAEAGDVIVMDPNTGAVLAMASRPSFDLRQPALDDPKAMERYRNRAVTDVYEPGSTFKVITMAGALHEGAVTPETTHVDAGPVIKYGRAIDNWDSRHHGTETMTQVLVRSNNVGAVWVADRQGPERFYRNLERFGFGQQTNVGLSGEAPGSVRYKQPDWTPIDLSTNAFGQGLSVTPLQLATAVSAIANGGTLMRPFVVQRIEGPEGARSFEPVPVRRAMSEDAAAKLRAMMAATAELGSGPAAKIAGFRVGGKTGTATVSPGATPYPSDATIASYVTFFPYEQPRAVVLVKVDYPKDIPWGSTVAVPVAANIAREMLIYWRIPPTESFLVAQVR